MGEFAPGLWQVVGINSEPVNPGTHAGIDGPGGQWAVEKRDEGFREAAGKGLQSIAKSRAEYESLIHRAGVAAGRLFFKHG